MSLTRPYYFYLQSTKYVTTFYNVIIFAEVSTYFQTSLFDHEFQLKWNSLAISGKNQTTSEMDGLETKWQIKIFLPCFGRKSIKLATNLLKADIYLKFYIFWSYVTTSCALLMWTVYCNPGTPTAAAT